MHAHVYTILSCCRSMRNHGYRLLFSAVGPSHAIKSRGVVCVSGRIHVLPSMSSYRKYLIRVSMEMVSPNEGAPPNAYGARNTLS